MIIIKKNQTSFKEILDIHLKCDKDFLPHLSARVDIFSYSQKVFKKAEILGAYDGPNFYGLAAMYCNDFLSKSAYITSVCLFKQYRGINIGNMLIERAIEHAKEKGMTTIKLEVGIDNLAAIKLYQKYGFRTIRMESEFFLMMKNLMD